MTTHDPAVSTASTVWCAKSATSSVQGGEGEEVPCASLADLESFTAELRRLGAGDDLAIDGAVNLSVTLSQP